MASRHSVIPAYIQIAQVIQWHDELLSIVNIYDAYIVANIIYALHKNVIFLISVFISNKLFYI